MFWKQIVISQFHFSIGAKHRHNPSIILQDKMVQSTYPPLTTPSLHKASPIVAARPIVRPRRRLGRRQGRFVLCIKILIKGLEKSNDKDLAFQVKRTVKQCTSQKLYPLQRNIAARLQKLVGLELWTWASLSVDSYLARRRQRLRLGTH